MVVHITIHHIINSKLNEKPTESIKPEFQML